MIKNIINYLLSTRNGTIGLLLIALSSIAFLIDWFFKLPIEATNNIAKFGFPCEFIGGILVAIEYAKLEDKNDE